MVKRAYRRYQAWENWIEGYVWYFAGGAVLLGGVAAIAGDAVARVIAIFGVVVVLYGISRLFFGPVPGRPPHE